MKRWIAMLLVTVLLLNVGCALADVDTEITFQNIPWGSDVLTVYDYVLENGLGTAPTQWNFKNLFQSSRDSFLTFGIGTYLHYDEEQESYELKSSSSEMIARLLNRWGDPEKKKIAGYDFRYIALTFMADETKESLITIRVELDWQDTSKAYADLQQKLSSVYGEGFHAVSAEGWDYYLWKGANNTAVMLMYNQDNLKLYYGTLDAEQWITDAEAQAETQDQPVDPDDTSGL